MKYQLKVFLTIKHVLESYVAYALKFKKYFRR